MRWKKEREPSPQGGETRTVRRFAWKRTEVGDQTVWLEFYEVHEQFFAPRGGGPGWWSETNRNHIEAMY
jgi:hypothetical protein